MTNSNKPHTKDPRGGWRAGKSEKRSTKKYIRRLNKKLTRRRDDE